MNTQELLDKVKVGLGVDTDYKLAKKLDIPDARISEYRNGKRVPNNYAIAKFAKVLEIDPWTLVKEIEAQTEKNPVRREFWQKAAVYLLGGILSVNLLVTPTPAEAAPLMQVVDSTVYIMSNRHNPSGGLVHSEFQRDLLADDSTRLTCSLIVRTKAFRKPLIFGGQRD